MSTSTLSRMNADEFIVWALAQPEGERYELIHGRVGARAPAWLAHARVKQRIVRLLKTASLSPD